MELSLYSELRDENNLETNDVPLFFSTKISLSDVDSATTFEDLYVKIIHKLELDPPDNLKGKIYSLQLHQINYWAQSNRRQFYQMIKIPSDLDTPRGANRRIEPPLAQRDGAFRIHFYTTHIQIGTVSLVKTK